MQLVLRESYVYLQTGSRGELLFGYQFFHFQVCTSMKSGAPIPTINQHICVNSHISHRQNREDLCYQLADQDVDHPR